MNKIHLKKLTTSRDSMKVKKVKIEKKHKKRNGKPRLFKIEI